MRAALLVALALLGAGKLSSKPRLDLTSPSLDYWGSGNSVLPTEATHRGTLPDGGSLVIFAPPGSRVVPAHPAEEWAFTLETPDGGASYHTVPKGTVLRQVDGGVVDLAHPEGHAHCWHLSPLQHTLANHRDVHCCHCGAAKCMSLPWAGLCGRGHGARCERPELDLKRPPE